MLRMNDRQGTLTPPGGTGSLALDMESKQLFPPPLNVIICLCAQTIQPVVSPGIPAAYTRVTLSRFAGAALSSVLVDSRTPSYRHLLLPSRAIPSKQTVLVHLDCRNRNPQTRWLINNRDVSLTDLEAGKSKVKELADLVSGEDRLPGS